MNTPIYDELVDEVDHPPSDVGTPIYDALKAERDEIEAINSALDSGQTVAYGFGVHGWEGWS